MPDEAALRDYYQTHPQLANVPERRHIAQLVLATCDEAQSMRKRILAGESLFELASEYSTDPYGRKHAGDMGWLDTGSGYPALQDESPKVLKDGEISEPVKTPKGCHIVMIQERQPSRQRGFADIQDEVRQALIFAKYAADHLKQLCNKIPGKMVSAGPPGQANSRGNRYHTAVSTLPGLPAPARCLQSGFMLMLAGSMQLLATCNTNTGKCCPDPDLLKRVSSETIVQQGQDIVGE